ncbi:MAG: hypothetical protein WA172_02220 [Terriglobales bacterium]|jgi:hypothetical protein
MPADQAAQCQHLKINGTRCGSPAQRNERFCYFHVQCRPARFRFGRSYADYSRSEVFLPAFEDTCSIQFTLRQVVELVMRKKLDLSEARLIVYALQIASSNLKRMAAEKPCPGQVVVDPPVIPVTEADGQEVIDPKSVTSAKTSATQDSEPTVPHKWSAKFDKMFPPDPEPEAGSDDKLPPGAIQACQSPHRRNKREKEYVI